MNKRKLWLYYFIIIISIDFYVSLFTNVDFVVLIFIFLLLPFSIMYGRKQIELKSKLNNEEIKRDRDLLFIYCLLSVISLVILSVIKLTIMNINR